MKIVHIINRLDIGGTQHLMCRHVAQLHGDRPDIQNSIVVLGRRADAHAPYVEMLSGADLHFLEFAGEYRNVPALARCIRRLRAVLRAQAPDIVHSYLWLSNMLGCYFGGGAAHVCHIVDRRFDKTVRTPTGRARHAVTSHGFRTRVSRFVAVSEACRTDLCDNFPIDPSLATVAYNGIRPGDFGACPPRADAKNAPPIMGMLSNFSAEKGHSVLIAACRILKSRGVRFRLLIGGEPGERRDIVAGQIAEAGVEQEATILGACESVADYLCGLDIFVMPSLYAEGLPTVILEAMATGLPVVATDVGGAREAIRDGVDGLLPPPDDPEALADALQDLLTDPARRSEYGEAARRRVGADFSLEAMTRNIIEAAYEPALADAAT